MTASQDPEFIKYASKAVELFPNDKELFTLKKLAVVGQQKVNEAAAISQLGLMCFLLETCLKVGEISQAFGGKEMVFHLGLVAFGILYSPIGTILSILMNINSRKNEFEADHYAKTTYSGAA